MMVANMQIATLQKYRKIIVLTNIFMNHSYDLPCLLKNERVNEKNI